MVLLNFEYVNIQECKDKIGTWTYNSFSVTSFRSFQNCESFFVIAVSSATTSTLVANAILYAYLYPLCTVGPRRRQRRGCSSWQMKRLLCKFEVFALRGKLPNGVMRPYYLACPWYMAHVLCITLGRSKFSAEYTFNLYITQSREINFQIFTLR